MMMTISSVGRYRLMMWIEITENQKLLRLLSLRSSVIVYTTTGPIDSVPNISMFMR
jgi:hypothetical protein